MTDHKENITRYLKTMSLEFSLTHSLLSSFRFEIFKKKRRKRKKKKKVEREKYKDLIAG